jgi:hypothetical protein
MSFDKLWVTDQFAARRPGGAGTGGDPWGEWVRNTDQKLEQKALFIVARLSILPAMMTNAAHTLSATGAISRLSALAALLLLSRL